MLRVFPPFLDEGKGGIAYLCFALRLYAARLSLPTRTRSCFHAHRADSAGQVSTASERMLLSGPPYAPSYQIHRSNLHPVRCHWHLLLGSAHSPKESMLGIGRRRMNPSESMGRFTCWLHPNLDRRKKTGQIEPACAAGGPWTKKKRTRGRKEEEEKKTLLELLSPKIRPSPPANIRTTTE